MELARNLRKDPVSRLEPSAPQMVAQTATIEEAVRAMRQAGTGCVLVCNNGHLAGLFTDRDLISRVLAVGKPLSTNIGEVMTTNLVTVTMKDSIRIAVRRMQAGGYRHLPVIDDDNKPAGVVSAMSVIQYLVDHYPSAVYNQPPDPSAVPSEAEGA
jgi:CBS domain-containing protein